MKVNNTFFLTVFLSAFGICYNIKNSYIAAVVDYNHEYADYPKELLSINVEQYKKHMRNASREYADIIVFPEFGLVDIFVIYDVVKKNVSGLDEYGSFVPDPELNIIPCEDTKMENYSMQLVEISCAARMHGLYTVFNLLEKGYNNETGDLEFYNTNIVLDRQGAVIARYRKINLSEEPFFQAGKELVTFTTDFNVTFGIFTCFDILFQYPAIDILSIPEVTDIIFTTAWYSETPFLQALSIQHGYAKTNGVNFLASGVQEPFNKDGGSGIYLADGTIAEMFVTYNKQTKIIVQDVPIIKNRIPATTCEQTDYTSTIRKLKKAKNEDSVPFTDIDNFLIEPENMTGYSFYPLNKGWKTLRRICSEDESFCCTFNITVDNSSTSTPDYTYKLALYKGVKPFGSQILGGMRVCALIACLDDNEITCGYKTNTSYTSVTFKSIQLKAFMEKTNDTYNQPATLRNDLTPVPEYMYCETDLTNDRGKILMSTTTPQDSIMTFGIYGRIYSDDTIIVPPTKEPLPELQVSTIIIIVSFSTILLIATAGILWKFCTNKD